MNLLLLAAAIGAAPPATPPVQAPDAADLRCYRLMAELAQAEDPAARALGFAAAQYFMGRIDAAAPGFDLGAAPAVEARERAALVRDCTDKLSTSGFDPAALGDTLERPEPTV